MKRLISFLLALSILTVSYCPAAYAAGTEKDEAAKTLCGLGLLQSAGNDKKGDPTFALDERITRNEAIVTVVRLLGKEDEALSKSWNTPFTDLSDWAKPYVGYAYAHRIIGGLSRTEYGGDSYVTANQYIAMLLRSLGYKSPKDFQINCVWELGDKIGLTRGEYGRKSKKFTRGDMAVLSFRALSLPDKKNGITFAEKMNGYDRMLTENLNDLYGYQAIQDDPAVLSAYHTVRKAVLSFDGNFDSQTLEFPMELTQSQFETAWIAFRGDYPQCFWFSPYMPQVTTANGKSKIEIKYSYNSSEELRKAKEIFDDSVKSVLKEAGVRAEMDDITKEALIYSYLGKHIRYDHDSMGDMQRTAYRAIVEHGGVCLGFANALTYVLQQAGIMAHVAEGKVISDGGNHAWTLVRLDGEYYYCDLTWDNHTDSNGNTSVTGNYFNFSRERFRELNHELYDYYPMPSGGNTSRDIFKKNGGLVSEMTVDAVAKAFRQKMFELEDGRVIIPIYVSDELGNLNDFHAWWGEGNCRNCWDVVKSAGLDPCSIAQIARLGNLWLLVTAPA